MKLRAAMAIACAGLLVGCGGGGSGSADRAGNDNRSGFAPNSISMSDILFGARGVTNQRVTMDCAPDLSSCTATWRGQTLTADEKDLELERDDEEGTGFLSFGSWDHMRFGVVLWDLEDGVRAKAAVVGGIKHPNSLETRGGAATWRGEMVALDHEDRLVRGNADLTIPDLSAPAVGVTLSPTGRAAMTWASIPVRGDGFEQERAPDDYIRGQFYGPYAQEVGGIFERDRMIGAFGGKR